MFRIFPEDLHDTHELVVSLVDTTKNWDDAEIMMLDVMRSRLDAEKFVRNT